MPTIKPALQKLWDLLDDLSDFVARINGNLPLSNRQIAKAQLTGREINDELAKKSVQNTLGMKHGAEIEAWVRDIVLGNTHAPLYYELCKKKVLDA